MRYGGGRSEATKKKSFVHSLNGHQGRVSGLVVRPCAHRQAITITSFCATRFVVWPHCLHVICPVLDRRPVLTYCIAGIPITHRSKCILLFQ